MLSTLARRLLPRAPLGMGQRGGHGYAPIPKPETSLDHVFGDNSYKVDFDVSRQPGIGPGGGSGVAIMCML